MRERGLPATNQRHFRGVVLQMRIRSRRRVKELAVTTISNLHEIWEHSEGRSSRVFFTPHVPPRGFRSLNTRPLYGIHTYAMHVRMISKRICLRVYARVYVQPYAT